MTWLPRGRCRASAANGGVESNTHGYGNDFRRLTKRLMTHNLSSVGAVVLLASAACIAPAQADPTATCNNGPGALSTECGTNSVATGAFGTAVGQLATATGEEATAVGTDSLASGVRSTAVGTVFTAVGVESTAIGNRSSTAADDPTAHRAPAAARAT